MYKRQDISFGVFYNVADILVRTNVVRIEQVRGEIFYRECPFIYFVYSRSCLLYTSHTLKIERSILFVQCIAHPEINLPMSFLETDASVQRAVEGLAYACLLYTSRCV